MLYFTRRPLKNPALVVFCLILAVSPCSAILTSPFFFDVSLLTSVLSPVPLWLRLAGGTGGISLWRDILVSFRKQFTASESVLPIHAGSRSIRRVLFSSRFWNDGLFHGCGWHVRLVVSVCVFSLNRFAVERIDHFTFPRLTYRRAITKSIVILCKCR